MTCRMVLSIVSVFGIVLLGSCNDPETAKKAQVFIYVSEGESEPTAIAIDASESEPQIRDRTQEALSSIFKDPGNINSQRVMGSWSCGFGPIEEFKKMSTEDGGTQKWAWTFKFRTYRFVVFPDGYVVESRMGDKDPWENYYPIHRDMKAKRDESKLNWIRDYVLDELHKKIMELKSAKRAHE